MLEAIRSRASSWVVKIFLGVLVLSFAVWGIGDVFRPSATGDAVASVGDLEVLPQDVEREFESRLADLRRRIGTGIDRAQAIQLGLMNQALQTTVARRLVDAHAAELGVTVSDEAVARMIREDPLFQGQNGFDRELFQRVLRAEGLSEAQFVADLRADRARGSLIGAVAAAASGSTTLAEAVWQHREEKRGGRALVVEAAKVEGVPQPTEADLESWMKANEQRFRAPEMRRFTLVRLLPEDLAQEITIPEERLREEYEARIAEYRVPETRDVEQILASDEATIRDAATRASSGEGFAEVVQALADRGARREELTAVTAGSLPPAFEDAIRPLAQGQVSEPVKSDFGWHLFRVIRLQPERTEPFEAKRDELARQLAVAQAEEQLPDIVAALEDEMAGGAPLEEAGRAVGARVETVGPIAADGLDAERKEPPGGALPPVVLADAFATAQGEVGAVKDLPGGGMFAVRVDAIEAERPRSLPEVRDEVQAGWLAEKRSARAKEIASELRDQVAAGATLESLARDRADVSVRVIEPLVRAAAEPVLGEGVVAALFRTAPGTVAPEVVEVADGSAVVVTDTVVPAPEPTDLAALQNELERGMRGDLLVQYEGALRRRFAVELNQRAMASLMGSGEPAN